MSDLVKVAVFGASGYSGMELLRYLLLHPRVEIVAVTSRTSAGKPLTAEFPRFRHVGNADSLRFSMPEVDAVKAAGASIAFLAMPHGVSVEYAKPLLAAGIKVIDLSADFRLRDAAVYQHYYQHAHPAPELLADAVYALPEFRAEEIAKANLIACPGCYPTSILLPLIPLLRAGLIADEPISVASMSGATGAGRKEAVPLLFCEVNESVRSYSVPVHRHLSEIGQELAIAAGHPVRLSFVPHLVPIHVGISTTIFCRPAPGLTVEKVEACLHGALDHSPFVRLLGRNHSPDTKNVARTNFVDIGWALDEAAGQLILLSTEDNIGKGAAGQAVQNFNLVCGFDQTLGLLTA